MIVKINEEDLKRTKITRLEIENGIITECEPEIYKGWHVHVHSDKIKLFRNRTYVNVQDDVASVSEYNKSEELRLEVKSEEEG